MSPNTENATSRLLLAIIRQKDLRDIDWDAVAKDPVLLQPITNGHAARMRLARFRTAVEGKEGAKKPRVSDAGKIQKTIKKSAKSKTDVIKTETNPSMSTFAQYSPISMASPYVGDTSPYVGDTSPYMADADQFDTRYMTPCSDDSISRVAVTTTQGAEFPSHGGMEQLAIHTQGFSDFEAAFDMSSYRMASTMPVDPLVGDFGDDWIARQSLF
jgi:hypothetical protein